MGADLFDYPCTYWKKYNSNTWVEITKYTKIANTLTFNQTLGTDLLEFSLTIIVPKDNNDDYIYISSGDEIIITASNARYEVLADILYGSVYNPSAEHLTYEYISADNDNAELLYNITVRQLDFSGITTEDPILEYKTSTSLSSILDTLLNQYTDENLGGVDAWGGIIPKYKLLAPNININSFESKNLSTLETLKALLSQNNYYFKMRYYCEPNVTYGLKVFQQIVIFDKSGEAPKNNAWSNGIKDYNIKHGLVANPRNIGGLVQVGVLNLKDKWIAEKDIKISENIDDLANEVKIIAQIQDSVNTASILNNNIPVNVTRYEEISPGFKDTFTLPYSAQDILFVARLIRMEVTSFTSPTSTVISVSQAHSDLINLNGHTDVIMLKKDGIEYFRTVSRSGQQLTLSSALPFTPNVGDIIEVVGNVDIYTDNQLSNPITTSILSSPTPTSSIIYIDLLSIKYASIEQNVKITISGISYIRQIISFNQTTGEILLNQTLPVSPTGGETIELINTGYATRGIVKNLKRGDKSQIRFLQYDVPNPNDTIVVYYIKLQDYNGLRHNFESKKRYKKKIKFEYELEFPVTQEQLERLYLSKLYTKPNITLDIITYRPDPAQVGWVIPVTYNNKRIDDKFLIISVNSKYIANSEYEYVFEQQISLKQKRDTFEDLINLFNKSVIKTTAQTPIDNRLLQNEDISVLDDFVENNIIELFSSLFKIYYKFLEGNGLTLNDTTIYNNHATLSSNVTWYGFSEPDPSIRYGINLVSSSTATVPNSATYQLPTGANGKVIFVFMGKLGDLYTSQYLLSKRSAGFIEVQIELTSRNELEIFFANTISSQNLLLCTEPLRLNGNNTLCTKYDLSVFSKDFVDSDFFALAIQVDLQNDTASIVLNGKTLQYYIKRYAGTYLSSINAFTAGFQNVSVPLLLSNYGESGSIVSSNLQFRGTINKFALGHFNETDTNIKNNFALFGLNYNRYESNDFITFKTKDVKDFWILYEFLYNNIADTTVQDSSGRGNLGTFYGTTISWDNTNPSNPRGVKVTSGNGAIRVYNQGRDFPSFVKSNYNPASDFHTGSIANNKITFIFQFIYKIPTLRDAQYLMFWGENSANKTVGIWLGKTNLGFGLNGDDRTLWVNVSSGSYGAFIKLQLPNSVSDGDRISLAISFQTGAGNTPINHLIRAVSNDYVIVDTLTSAIPIRIGGTSESSMVGSTIAQQSDIMLANFIRSSSSSSTTFDEANSHLEGTLELFGLIPNKYWTTAEMLDWNLNKVKNYYGITLKSLI